MNHRFKIHRPRTRLSLLVIGLFLFSGADSPTERPAATSPQGDAPPYFERLIEAGNVSFEYHDPKTFEAGDGGVAWFDVRVRHRFRYSYRSTRQNDGRRLVVITPKIRRTTIDVRHVVTLPFSYDNPEKWKTRLVRHEFDHVAVSTDSRAYLLVEHLIHHLGTLRRTLAAGPEPEAAWLNGVIGEEINKRRDAVEELIRANYRLLDDVSRHGRRRIPDRQAFFHGLYTRENLEKMAFPYLSEAEDLLKTDKYRNAPLFYNDEPNF
ncbi:MAG: hypothetical protein ABIP48_06865 [Planctomycetota bacterium]